MRDGPGRAGQRDVLALEAHLRSRRGNSAQRHPEEHRQCPAAHAPGNVDGASLLERSAELEKFHGAVTAGRTMAAVEPAEQNVMQMARGYQLSQALYVAAKLGVADVLDTEPLPAEAIAETVGARPSQLRRVLRALVAAGVFRELEDGRFASNDAAATLRADAPSRMRDVVVNFGEEMYRSFGELLHTVRTGETAFDRVYGAPLFEYYATHPETEASAAARMVARTLPVARELAASDLLRGARTLVDVGGGTGTLVAEVLRHRPELTGVLLERPGMLALARPYLADQGVADRCELVEGDFFASVPAGGDVYVLKSVLHDWDDERCVTILRTCRAAMDDAARLVDRRAEPPGAHGTGRPDARRGPARPDHAGLRRWARAHRARVRGRCWVRRGSGCRARPRSLPGRTCSRPSPLVATGRFSTGDRAAEQASE